MSRSELIWWTKWHECFVIMYVINNHHNDQWLQCHCAQLLHIGLNTEGKVTCYQIHFYSCRNNNRAICHVQWVNVVALIFLLPRSITSVYLFCYGHCFYNTCFTENLFTKKLGSVGRENKNKLTENKIHSNVLYNIYPSVSWDLTIFWPLLFSFCCYSSVKSKQ